MRHICMTHGLADTIAVAVAVSKDRVYVNLCCNAVLAHTRWTDWQLLTWPWCAAEQLQPLPELLHMETDLSIQHHQLKSCAPACPCLRRAILIPSIGWSRSTYLMHKLSLLDPDSWAAYKRHIWKQCLHARSMLAPNLSQRSLLPLRAIHPPEIVAQTGLWPWSQPSFAEFATTADY